MRAAAVHYITNEAAPSAALDPANSALFGAVQGCQPVAVAACELHWAQAAAAALGAPTGGARRHMLSAMRSQLLEARAGCIAHLTRRAGEPSGAPSGAPSGCAARRSLHGALALAALSWAEVVDELSDAEAESEEAFAWQRLARYEWDDKSSTLSLRLLGWHVQCGAEMLGPARLFVRVAASRRLGLGLGLGLGSELGLANPNSNPNRLAQAVARPHRHTAQRRLPRSRLGG